VDAAEREAIARRSIDAWNDDDWEGQLKEVWKQDGLIVTPDGWPEAGRFEGWDAMVEQWRRVKDSWAEDHVELTSMESHGEAVLAATRWVVRGEASGAPLEVEIWALFEFEGGRISKLVYFMDGRAARSAAEEAR
jgi:ketosteroid isomerase-like protein